MGRIVYAMLQSLDGFIADADGAITLPVPDAALHRHFNEQMRATALSIYGRRMWEVMTYWGEDDPDRDPVGEEFARLWRATPKVVVSRTLETAPEGTTLVRSDVVEAVRALKHDVAGDIEVAGARLAGTLSRAGLIDEYRLYLQPVVLGSGTPYFADGVRPALGLLGVERLPQDTVLLRYAPA